MRTHDAAKSSEGFIKSDIASIFPRSLRLMSESDEDVQFVGARGDDVLRNAPHARFDCLVHRFADDPTQCCDKCCCWVCDVPVGSCAAWAQHCKCDGSLEWTALRQRRRREVETARAAQRALPSFRPPKPTEEEVVARYAAAAAVAAGGGAQPGQSTAPPEQQVPKEGEDEEDEDLFSEYEPFHFHLGQPHPDPVVETTSLAFADLPPIEYQLRLPRELLAPRSASNPRGGALSKLQLETVSYACQQHAYKLPSGERSGFFLGDGVGLGKGRQLAGIVLENALCGHRRHVWLSVSSDLMHDAQRDLADIGAAHLPLHNLTDLPYGRIDAQRSSVGAGRIESGVPFCILVLSLPCLLYVLYLPYLPYLLCSL